MSVSIDYFSTLVFSTLVFSTLVFSTLGAVLDPGDWVCQSQPVMNRRPVKRMARRIAQPKSLIIGFAIASLLALTGCGDSDDSASSASESVELEDETFLSDSVTGHDLVEGSQIRLSFEEERLAVNAGCNTMSGAYTQDAGTLVWDGPAASTQMACDQGLMDQDQWLYSLFEEGVETSSDGADLVLTSGEVTMKFSKVDD